MQALHLFLRHRRQLDLFGKPFNLPEAERADE